MMVLISYDIATGSKKGQKRLRKVAKICKNYGQRVQFSVFECSLDPTQWLAVRQELIDVINDKEDSLRFYFLGANWKKRIEHIGIKESYDPEGPMVV